MKFSLKLLLWTMVVMAAALGCSGFYIVNFVFQSALEREINQALDENGILRFAFETAALNAPAKYDVLQDTTVEQISSNLETGGHDSSRLIRISDEDKQVLYESMDFEANKELLDQAQKNTKLYRIIRMSDGEQPLNGYFIQTGSTINVLDRVIYLETLKDVSGVFEERAIGFSVYRRVTVMMLCFGMVVMLLIASWLTKPIRLLTRATKRMAVGDYDYRAKQVSNDELGQLTTDFNKMANALEVNMNKLEEEIQSREEFVAAFAHELKTPLTSIIGYADLLRSRKLDEEKSFLSANYIYTEGKRLEAMSLRLLDIIVTGKSGAEFQKVPAEVLFQYLRDMFSSNENMVFDFRYDIGQVRAELHLIKTVLINLVDNACKASDPGSTIEVEGRMQKDGYEFLIRDYGVGIPETELKNITKAFYMVDKSRARSKNGAGLGLALCAEILHLHGSSLKIESEPGKGTCMSFLLPGTGGEESADEKDSYQ